MAFPENAEQLFKGYSGWIELNLYCFGMVSEAVIRGVLFRPSRISHAGPYDARNDPEPGVRPPESAEGEGSSFHYRRRICVYGRNMFEPHTDHYTSLTDFQKRFEPISK